MFAWKILSNKIRKQSISGWKNLQKIHLTKDHYPKCTRNALAQAVRKQPNLKWAKDLYRHSPNEDIKMTNKLKYCISLENCKLKSHLHITIEKSKPVILITPNAGEDVKQQEHSYLAGGNEKCHNYIGIQFSSFSKSKHTLPYDPVTALLRIYSYESKLTTTKKIGHGYYKTALFMMA